VLRLGGLVALVGVVAAGVACAGCAGSSSATTTVRSRVVGLCPFPLEVTVASLGATHAAPSAALQFRMFGPSRITLRNATTGRSVTLDAPGSYTIDPHDGTVTFRGSRLWLAADDVPFLATDGTGRLVAPTFVLAAGTTRTRVVDPCALVASSPPSTSLATTRGAWPAPAYPLTRIAAAGLTPVIGTLIRHDHVHLDVVVDGRKVTVPAGVGLADPIDSGACPVQPDPDGDCRTGHVDVPGVAYSPLHTHSTSGLIHIESDRPGSFTLGQFFTEWGVRLSRGCVGGYCDGHGDALRVYVDGRLDRGNPREIVLGNHQEIAVVFGDRAELGSAPSIYRGGWPGLGCGGSGEPSCLP
jgi:hypothetical protein